MMTADELRARVGGVRVFARIRPEQKLALVDAFHVRAAMSSP